MWNTIFKNIYTHFFTNFPHFISKFLFIFIFLEIGLHYYKCLNINLLFLVFILVFVKGISLEK